MQLVYVDTDGSPAVDRGLTKRTYAPVHGRRDRAGMPAPAERGRSGGRRRRAGRLPRPGLPGAPLLQSQPWAPPAWPPPSSPNGWRRRRQPGYGRTATSPRMDGPHLASATGESWSAWSMTPEGMRPGPPRTSSAQGPRRPGCVPWGSTNPTRPGRSMPGLWLKRRTGPGGRSPGRPWPNVRRKS